MNIPRCVRITLAAGLVASLASNICATPVATGYLSVGVNQTGAGSVSSPFYTAGLSLNSTFGNPGDNIEPSAYLPAAISFSSSSTLMSGSEVSLGFSPGSEQTNGSGYWAVAIGSAQGNLANGWGYYSASMGLYSADAADLNATMSATLSGGVDDGYRHTFVVDASLLPAVVLFSGQTCSNLLAVAAGQETSVALETSFQSGTTNEYWLLDDLGGLKLSGLFGPGESSFVITAGLLEAGRDYRVITRSRFITGPQDAPEEYLVSNSLKFSVGVPDDGATALLLAGAMVLLLRAGRRDRGR